MSWTIAENKDADTSEKKPSRGQWSKNRKPRGTSTHTITGKKKFKGACNDMKEHVFDLSRSQADN